MDELTGQNSGLELDLMLFDLTGERVSMDAERIGGLAEVTVRLLDDAGDESLVELAHRVLVVDAFLDHLGDELIQQLMQRACPLWPWRTAPLPVPVR